MVLAVKPMAGQWNDPVAERFAPILDRSPEGIALCEEGKVFYANEAFITLLGCENLKDVLFKELGALRLSPRCASPASELRSSKVCPGRPTSELEFQPPNSSRVEATCAPFTCEGRNLLLLTLRDVSERERRRILHESVYRLRAILRSVPIGIVQCLNDGRIVETNPVVEGLLGYSHAELKGIPLQGFLRGDSPDQFLRLFQQATGETYHAEYRYISRQAGDRWLKLTAVLVPETFEGEPLVTAILEDVTEYKCAERQLRDAQKMEVIGRLVGGVAHDFNNLLTGIMLYCDLLTASLTDAKLRQHAEEIRLAGEQGAALVQQLLAISRQQVVEPRTLCMNTKIADTRELLSRLIGENIELCAELDPALGNIKIDPAQFQQILLNLVLNARDAMPGGGCIRIRTANSELPMTDAAIPDRPLSAVKLSVIDHGCGMSEETRSHLFEPFFTTKAAGRGTGLGLATVHDIVQAACGKIEVESVLAVGTTFHVILPRVPDSSNLEIPNLPYSPLTAQETILVLVDNAILRQAVRRILRECGYLVLEASTGNEALALGDIHPGPIDLLLSDLNLRGLSGKTIARRLGVANPNLKCLYICGHDPQPSPSSIETDPVVFFRKPFSGSELLQRVREILDARLSAPPSNEGDKNHERC